MSLLKRSLILFWSVWLTVVFATNVCDGLKEIGGLDESWRFASGNFRFVAETTARYDAPDWLNRLLFAGVILWEGCAALLFWCAWWTARRGDLRSLYRAFFVSLLLWGAFMVADELLIAYRVEATHMGLFTAQLATLLAIVLLPEEQVGSPDGRG